MLKLSQLGVVPILPIIVLVSTLQRVWAFTIMLLSNWVFHVFFVPLRVLESKHSLLEIKSPSNQKFHNFAILLENLSSSLVSAGSTWKFCCRYIRWSIFLYIDTCVAFMCRTIMCQTKENIWFFYLQMCMYGIVQSLIINLRFAHMSLSLCCWISFFIYLFSPLLSLDFEMHWLVIIFASWMRVH